MSYRRVAQLKIVGLFWGYLEQQGLDLPFDEEIQPGGPLAQPYQLAGWTALLRRLSKPFQPRR